MTAIIFVLIAIAARFAIAYNPSLHLWTIAPVAPALLFFGSRISRKYAWAPVAALAAADIVLCKAVYGTGVSYDLLVTFAWYAAIVFLGGWLKSDAKPLKLVASALTSSASFFVVSNFAYWIVWPTYPHTWSGLMTCYAAALPFFRNTPVSDLLFTFAFFSIGALVENRRQAEKGSLA